MDENVNPVCVVGPVEGKLKICGKIGSEDHIMSENLFVDAEDIGESGHGGSYLRSPGLRNIAG